ncbi:hypothetical protein ACR0ST_07855 [Aliidiomarina sp. Khilg15.8]
MNVKHQTYLHNPVSFSIAVLFIVMLFIDFLDLPGDQMFDMPQLLLSNGSLGTWLVISAVTYAVMLLFGFYPWVTRFVGLTTVILLGLQFYAHSEDLLTVADTLGIGIDEIQALSNLSDDSMATDFLRMGYVWFFGIITALFIITLVLPRSKNRKI